jgi:hypothetical protein
MAKAGSQSPVNGAGGLGGGNREPRCEDLGDRKGERGSSLEDLGERRENA